MDGAGSLIAANYTYNKADRDGTFIGVWNSAFVLYQALGDKAVRLDARKLNWIGAPIKGSPGCNIMGFTGLKTMDDVVKSGRSLKMGSTRAGSTYSDLPLILNQTVGTKFNVINGYKGTSQITVAMRSKELDGGCWGWESARVTARAMLDAQGRPETDSDHHSQQMGRSRVEKCSFDPRLHQIESRPDAVASTTLGQSI